MALPASRLKCRPKHRNARHGGSSGVGDPPVPLVSLLCETCGVCLHLDELRRESLDVLGQELVEVQV